MGQGGSSDLSLDEKYFLQKVRLGQGSFGTVWRAVDRVSSQVVAIKQLDKSRMRRCGVSQETVNREVAMMRACEHENITQLLDTFEDSESIFLAQEYCDGGDFGDKVRERGLSLQEPEAAAWMRQVVSSVNFLHGKRICHRDIKPDNFMIRESAAGFRSSRGSLLKLSDFGLAVYLPHGKLLTEKCGTPAFMSPEQHLLKRGSPGYGLATDMWAVGVTMYQVMFGGRHPFLSEACTKLEEEMLLKGVLDFRLNQDNMGFFSGLDNRADPGLRYSEVCRRLCSCMVFADPQRRMTAMDAVNNSWFYQDGSPNSSPAGTPTQAQFSERAAGAPASLAADRRGLTDQGKPYSMSTTSTSVSTRQTLGGAHGFPTNDRPDKPFAQPMPLRAFSEELWKRPAGTSNDVSAFLALSEPATPVTATVNAAMASAFGACGLGLPGPEAYGYNMKAIERPLPFQRIGTPGHRGEPMVSMRSPRSRPASRDSLPAYPGGQHPIERRDHRRQSEPAAAFAPDAERLHAEGLRFPGWSRSEGEGEGLSPPDPSTRSRSDYGGVWGAPVLEPVRQTQV